MASTQVACQAEARRFVRLRTTLDSCFGATAFAWPHLRLGERRLEGIERDAFIVHERGGAKGKMTAGYGRTIRAGSLSFNPPSEIPQGFFSSGGVSFFSGPLSMSSLSFTASAQAPKLSRNAFSCSVRGCRRVFLPLMSLSFSGPQPASGGDWLRISSFFLFAGSLA